MTTVLPKDFSDPVQPTTVEAALLEQKQKYLIRRVLLQTEK
tara:strand:+ start:364 stop:486 length:123 start_codon:yes stop_codon:yes gene_type:complete